MQKKSKHLVTLLLLLLTLTLGACGDQGRDLAENVDGERTQKEQRTEEVAGAKSPASFDDMAWEKGMELSYASQFFVEKSGDYQLITIVRNDRFLLIPEGKAVPEGVPEDVIILQKPLDRVYLASSSVFDLIRQAGALGNVRFSGTKKEELSIAEAAQAMERGDMLFAGKYSKPDYELLVGEGCDLAVENTMIYHNPAVKEKLESLGMPVMVETSSYEEHPFGRMEWIKLYGLLFDQLDAAEEFFDRQVALLEPILQQDGTGERVAFFYVNANGVVNVRKPGDYVTKMISLAGGEYFMKEEAEEENALSTMNVQMEEFYLSAKDADVLIYNSTIVGELKSLTELIALNPLFADFKAVKEGRVYCTEKNFFQETTAIGDFVDDLSNLLRHPEETDFHQLFKLSK